MLLIAMLFCGLRWSKGYHGRKHSAFQRVAFVWVSTVLLSPPIKHLTQISIRWIPIFQAFASILHLPWSSCIYLFMEENWVFKKSISDTDARSLPLKYIVQPRDRREKRRQRRQQQHDVAFHRPASSRRRRNASTAIHFFCLDQHQHQYYNRRPNTAYEVIQWCPR